MIFVTVGTHEQQFNRLIKEVDRLKSEGIIKDEVIMQIGFSTYEPVHCKASKLLSYDEMSENISKARIVITHGGPASFLAPLQVGKIPIVVPRQKQFDEHVNNHQLEFARVVKERQGNIILVENISNLEEAIIGYNELVENMPADMKSNNAAFCAELEEIVGEMF